MIIVYTPCLSIAIYYGGDIKPSSALVDAEYRSYWNFDHHDGIYTDSNYEIWEGSFLGITTLKSEIYPRLYALEPKRGIKYCNFIDIDKIVLEYSSD